MCTVHPCLILLPASSRVASSKPKRSAGTIQQDARGIATELFVGSMIGLMIGHRRFKSVQLSFAIPAHQAVERTRTRVCPATPTRTSQEGHPPPDEVETPRTFLDTSPECLPYAEARSPSGRAHFVLRPFGQKDRDEYGAALRSIKPASGTPIVNDRGVNPASPSA